MSSRKYANDYRLENIETKSGKLKTVAVYGGASYVFEAGAETLAAAKKQLAGCVLVFWIAQFTALFLNTRCARCMWVIMPQAFALLAFGFVSVAVWMLIRAEDKMTREYAQKTRDRFSGGALMAMLLNGTALIGSLIAAVMFRKELYLPADIFYITLTALAQAVCIFAFIKRDVVKIRALDGAAKK